MTRFDGSFFIRGLLIFTSLRPELFLGLLLFLHVDQLRGSPLLKALLGHKIVLLQVPVCRFLCFDLHWVAGNELFQTFPGSTTEVSINSVGPEENNGETILGLD